MRPGIFNGSNIKKLAHFDRILLALDYDYQSELHYDQIWLPSKLRGEGANKEKRGVFLS